MRYKGILIAGVLLLSACTLKPVYNNLYWLVPWYLEDYVTLDSAQEQQVRDELRVIIREHRTHQIPRYSDFLRSMKPALNGASEEQVQQYYIHLKTLWDELKALLAPAVIAFFQSLTPEQQQEFFDNLRQHNAEQREEFRNSDIGWMEHHRERTKSLIEYFLGEVTQEQLVFLDEYLSQRERGNLIWVENRERWQALLLDALQNGGDKETLQHLIVHSDDYWTEEYRRVLERNRSLAITMVSKISYTLTPSQQQYLSEQLDDMAAELDAL